MVKANQIKFLEMATEKFGVEAVVAVADLVSLAEKNAVSGSDHHWLYKPAYRVGRGTYKLPAMNMQEALKAPVIENESIAAMAADKATTCGAGRIRLAREAAIVPNAKNTAVAIPAMRLVNSLFSLALRSPLHQS